MVTARQYLKRQDESFLRITPPQLYELFSEYESDGREDVANGSGIGGGFAGGGPMIVTHESEDTPAYDRPYLLLGASSLRPSQPPAHRRNRPADPIDRPTDPPTHRPTDPPTNRPITRCEGRARVRVGPYLASALFPSSHVEARPDGHRSIQL